MSIGTEVFLKARRNEFLAEVEAKWYLDRDDPNSPKLSEIEGGVDAVANAYDRLMQVFADEERNLSTSGYEKRMALSVFKIAKEEFAGLDIDVPTQLALIGGVIGHAINNYFKATNVIMDVDQNKTEDLFR